MRRLVTCSILAVTLVLGAGHDHAFARQRSARDLAAQLRASDPAARAGAACQLRELGDRAGDAIDALVGLLDDATPVAQDVCDDRRSWRGDEGDLASPGEHAAAALVAIGSRAFTPVLGALKSPNWAARRNSAWALGALRDP